ncbi:hypothetical protein ACFWZ2_02445 [Streptomyces sp. NPDC059002]|uniref:hypothetical protein n=1 Tax=Streptomyces sp. NPDC059002 TaxID=3346690 RepID=UPI0036B6BCF7
MDDRPVNDRARDGHAVHDCRVDARTLVNEIEGHLLVEAARAEGRTAAERFTERLPWLTDAQRAETERWYAEEHVELTRLGWQHIARRTGQLRTEYEETYRLLRRRLLVRCQVVVGCLLAVVLALEVAGR